MNVETIENQTMGISCRSEYLPIFEAVPPFARIRVNADITKNVLVKCIMNNLQIKSETINIF